MLLKKVFESSRLQKQDKIKKKVASVLWIWSANFFYKQNEVHIAYKTSLLIQFATVDVITDTL